MYYLLAAKYSDCQHSDKKIIFKDLLRPLTESRLAVNIYKCNNALISIHKWKLLCK